MNHNKEFLLKKNKGKLYLQDYLKELNSICNFNVTTDNLLSLEKTEQIIMNRKNVIKERIINSTTIHFKNKNRLKQIFDELYSRVDGEIYLFTEYSKYCGALRLENLGKFNYNFNFEDEHAGILSFMSKDLNDKLILDFFEDGSERLLEIEVEGIRWNDILD